MAKKVVTEPDPIPTGKLYRCGLSGCSKTFGTPHGLQVHRRLKHKKRPTSTGPQRDDITIQEAAREHLNKSHKVSWFTCASRPCTHFSRADRRKYFETGDMSNEAPKPSIEEVLGAAVATGFLDPHEDLRQLVNGQSAPPAPVAPLTVQNFEARPPVQIAVYYLDDTTRWYPVNEQWRVDTVRREIVIGRGIPRTHIPLDTVRAYHVEPYDPGTYHEE
jgi:hypothetical protein